MPIRGACLVMLDQAFENLLQCQALMPKDINERVADAERFAGVYLGTLDADRPLHKSASSATGKLRPS